MPKSGSKNIPSRTFARGEIDRIDRALIALLGERKQYADYMGRTPTPPDVNTTEVFLAFMEDRRTWATEEVVSGEFIDRIYAIITQDYLDGRQKHSEDRPRVLRAD